MINFPNLDSLHAQSCPASVKCINHEDFSYYNVTSLLVSLEGGIREKGKERRDRLGHLLFSDNLSLVFGEGFWKLFDDSSSFSLFSSFPFSFLQFGFVLDCFK